MNAQVRKEVRLLLPAWSAAMGLAVLPFLCLPLIGSESLQLSLPPHAVGVGMLLLGLASFGQEFNNGTFSILLAQPAPRIRLWNTKVSVLACAMISVFAAYFLAQLVSIAVVEGLPSHLSDFHPDWSILGANLARLAFSLLKSIGLAALVFFASGLWTTLLLRQVSAALWFSLLVPGMILAAMEILFDRAADGVRETAVASALVLYSVAGIVLARRMFLRAQDAQWTGGVITLPGWMGSGRTARVNSARAQGRRPIQALLAKELQSHQVSIMIAGVLLALHLIAVFARKIGYQSHRTSDVYALLGFAWVLWCGLPFLIGSTPIAEERKQGTLESLLCLPVSRRVQFVIKLVPALLLGILLGGVAPWLLERMAVAINVPDSALFWKTQSGVSYASILGIIAAAAFGTTLVSFLASSLTRNLLQSLGAAILIAIGISTFGGLALIDASHGSPSTGPLWDGPLIAYIGAATFVTAIILLAYRNLGQLQVNARTWCRNIITLAASFVFICTATALVWNRAWELVTPVEPRHGPPTLHGSIRPELAFTYHRAFALLPDGRLWGTTQFAFRPGNHYEWEGTASEGRYKRAQVPVPTAGTFLGGSNWVGLAATLYQVAGVQSDGSLWSVGNDSSGPELKRIGNDSDWKSVVAEYNFFVAIKTNGTMWFWGARRSTNSLPARFDEANDWDAAFVEWDAVFGVKRDGSVWKSIFAPQKNEQLPFALQPFGNDGTNWIAMSLLGSGEIITKRDGTLWVMGESIPSRLLGNEMPQQGPRRDYPTPRQVGTESDWAEGFNSSSGAAGLKRNGLLIMGGADYRPDLYFWKEPRRPSKYSDWIAITDSRLTPFAALAADGTLSAWTNPQVQTESFALLGPTRKPTWSVNILELAKEQ